MRTRTVGLAAGLAALLLLVLMASSCAAGNPMVVEGGPGFWRGLVHGWIAPVTFFISLFKDDVSLYEVRNNGGWYDFGFLFGLSFWGGGSHAATRRRWPTWPNRSSEVIVAAASSRSEP